MGKLNHGPNSKAKGKAGAFVYQQYEGLQVFKEYQPTVKNPNAPGQVATRTRFSLASKTNAMLFPWLSPIMKSVGIAYERFQRGNMLKKLMGVITYDDVEEHAVMGRFPSIKENSEIPGTFSLTVSIQNNAVHATAKLNEAFDEGNPIAYVKCVLFPSDGTTPMTSEAETSSLDPTTGEEAFEINLPAGFAGSVVVLGYLSKESEFATGVTYNDVVGSASPNIATLGNSTNLSTAIVLSQLISKTIWTA